MNTPAPVPAGRLGAGKRWLFRLTVLAALAGLTEAGSYFAYWAIDGHALSYARIRQERRLLRPRPGDIDTALDPLTTDAARFTIHPYLGFSYNHDWKRVPKYQNPITEWGFTARSDHSIVSKRGPNKVIVGILGASVATVFSAQGTDALARELKNSPRFSGKEIEFVNLAVGAYKQPQQLIALNYALGLGAEFDVIVNLDGLNEIAWYKQDNGEHDVFHFFPSGWHRILQFFPDPQTRQEVGKLSYLAEQRLRWASVFLRAPLRYSPTANLLWKVRDRHLAAGIVEAATALHERERHGLPAGARGPRNTFHGEQEMLAQLVTNWERCSLLIHQICQARGIVYYHCLQPNQYVPGSKPLSAEEKKVAWLETMPGRAAIVRGYPLLREAGRRLARQGVRFHDLSMVFAHRTETFYFDTCCHINRPGSEALGTAIARAVLETPEPPRAPEAHTQLGPQARTGGQP